MGFIRGPPLKPPYAVIWPSLEMLGLCLLRTIIGLATVIAIRAVMKPISSVIMKSLVQMYKGTNSKDNEGFIIIGAKLMCYALIGIDINCFVPVLFRLLNIERPTVHTEI